MYGRGWTNHGMKIARDMRLAGHTYADIGEQLGRRPSSVKSFLLRNRILPSKEVKHSTMLKASIRREAMKKAGATWQLVVTNVAVPESVIAERDRRVNEYRTPAQELMGDPAPTQSALGRPCP